MSGGEGGKVIQVCADLGGRLFLHDDTRAVGRRGKGVAVCIKQVVAMSLEPMRQVVGVEMDVVHMQRWIPDRNGCVGRSDRVARVLDDAVARAQQAQVHVDRVPLLYPRGERADERRTRVV